MFPKTIFDPAFAGFDWFITEASQREHRVGKDVGFGIRKSEKLYDIAETWK